MGFNVHDVFRKVVAYYTRKHKKLKNQFLFMIQKYYHLKKTKH